MNLITKQRDFFYKNKTKKELLGVDHKHKNRQRQKDKERLSQITVPQKTYINDVLSVCTSLFPLPSMTTSKLLNILQLIMHFMFSFKRENQWVCFYINKFLVIWYYYMSLWIFDSWVAIHLTGMCPLIIMSLYFPSLITLSSLFLTLLICMCWYALLMLIRETKTLDTVSAQRSEASSSSGDTFLENLLVRRRWFHTCSSLTWNCSWAGEDCSISYHGDLLW